MVELGAPDAEDRSPWLLFEILTALTARSRGFSAIPFACRSNWAHEWSLRERQRYDYGVMLSSTRKTLTLLSAREEKVPFQVSNNANKSAQFHQRL